MTATTTMLIHPRRRGGATDGGAAAGGRTIVSMNERYARVDRRSSRALRDRVEAGADAVHDLLEL